MTQCDRVLQYMQEQGGISSFQAFMKLGIVSLPKRICELRKLGHNIKGEYVEVRNRNDELTHYKQYTLM